jgi:LDH2 family malate/lactate/ureidoglycolate dehydrogenase
MSANNMITINKKTYEVQNVDAETGYGNIVGKGKSLEEAIEIAEKEMEENIVEYGIHFVDK